MSAPEPPAERPDRDTLTDWETLMLYGQSAGRCAKCKKEVVRHRDDGRTYGIGLRAHIVARSDGGPRADPSMSKRQRGDLMNHLLLCGACHDEVDVNEDDWPVERLHEVRAAHLAWIGERLGDDQAVDPERLVYARAIDAAVELVWLDAWAKWTDGMLDPRLSWAAWQVDRAIDFRYRMAMTDWPGSEVELEVALARLAHLVAVAAERFVERARPRGESELHVFKEFKRGINPNYALDAARHRDWVEHYDGLIWEATKAAAWVRESWRAAGNPAFMAGERVHILIGPYDQWEFKAAPAEYTSAEKAALLAAGRDGVSALPAEPLRQSQDDELLALIEEMLREVLWAAPSPHLVSHLHESLISADEPIFLAHLFHDAPGPRLDDGQLKRVGAEMLRQDLLRRNPAGRGYLRGEAAAS